MGKSKAAKRKNNAQIEYSNKSAKLSTSITTPPPDKDIATDPRNISSLISEDDLETTIDTLQTLAEYPSIIKSKACKDLRVAVYDFRQACTTGVNSAVDTSLTARITAALTDGKYTDALILLAEMRIRGETPKLGALCRWVRDLDVVSGLSNNEEGTHHQIERPETNKERLRILDSILRVAGPTDFQSTGAIQTTEPIAIQDMWDLRDQKQFIQIYQSALDGSILHANPSVLQSQFRIIERTPGPLRKPPNLHPAILYASKDNTIPLSTPSPTITKHTHPTVPNLTLLKDVLSPNECTSMISAAQTLGFTPDAPLTPSSSSTSVLAHNFYWLADAAFTSTLWSRVSPHLPRHIKGRQVRGLNRRFRIYRYIPGAEYRCHIDGAWPPSGIDPISDEYIYDSSPPGAKQSSLFTFLIYLNDEFEGGETTFFVPSVREGVMNGFPVRPVMGSVVVFPHGEGEGALLHEGTGVRVGGKYIIRTDVLYDVDGEGVSV